MERLSTEKKYDLSTITRDDLLTVLIDANRNELLILLRTSIEEMKKLTPFIEKVEKCKKLIKKENEKEKSAKDGLTGGITVIIISFLAGIFFYKEPAVPIVCAIVIVFSIIFYFSQKINIKNAQDCILKYEEKMSDLQNKVNEIADKCFAIWYFPDEFWDEYALTTMLKYVERGSTNNWGGVTKLYDEHEHRRKMENMAHRNLVQSMLQTEIAKDTRNAARWAAAGSWASAAGIWRINSRL